MSTKESKKLTTDRSVAFKKKDSGIDKRNLRAHRRSIEWKHRRGETVNLRRGDVISPLSPLKEVHTNTEDVLAGPVKVLVKPTKPAELVKTKAQKAAEERREMLEKWRKEKELKKKLEAQGNAQKKTFKVAHVDNALISSRKFDAIPKPHAKVDVKKSPVLAKGRKALHKSPKRPVSSNKRVTRSQTNKPAGTRDSKVTAPKKETKVLENKKTVKSNSQVPGRQVQSTKQAMHNQVKSVDSTKKRPVFQQPCSNKHPSRVTNNKASELLNRNNRNGKLTDSVTCFRGTRISSSELSFAPTDFKFSAPSNLQSFIFQPLSPRSAADFLVPGNDLSKFTPPSTKRCSTPISQTKTINSKNNLLGSESSGEEKPKKDGKKAGKVLKRTSKEPVMSMEKESPKSPKPTVDVRQPIEEDKDVHNTEVKDTSSEEKKTPVKVEPQKTPARRKSLRKSHTSEPMPSGKIGGTQSVPDDLLYGGQAVTDTSNLENQPPAVTERGPADNVFRTPAPCPPPTRVKRTRTCSLGTALLLSNSAKKFRTPRNNRNSLILSTLSPEDSVKVLENSPMIVLQRRTPKPRKSPAVALNSAELMPSFDDIEAELEQAAAEHGAAQGLGHSTASDERVAADGDKEAITGRHEHSLVTDTVGEMSCNTEDMHTGPSVEDGCTSDESGRVTNNSSSSSSSTTIQAGGDSSQATLVVDTVTEVPSSKDETTLPLLAQLPLQHDVPYFRDILVVESRKLQVLCDRWEEINSTTEELEEEARGQIRTAIGKAQLLMAQRFKQFSGLVDNCEFKTGEKETTCTDLEGFWEMVYFQVEDVHNMFADLDKKRSNGWQCEEQPLVVKKKVIKKKKATTNVTSSKPGGKSKFAAFRAKMKQPQNTVDMVENKAFVSGIFRIESPVKKVAPHCQGGTPGKMPKKVTSRNNTPCGSPLLKAVMERNARKSHGPSPLVVDSTCPQNPVTESGGKRKRKPSSETDYTPAKVSRMECKENTATEHPLIGGRSIFSPDSSVLKKPKRLSLRRSLRKSVTWDQSEVSDSPLKENIICDQQTTAQGASNIMSQFLEPTVVQESDMEVDSVFSPPEDVDMSAISKRALKSEFDKHSSSAKKGNTPRRRSVRLVSAEKSLSSQRKARRTVHFSGSRTSEDSPVALKMPVTPFNKDSIVPRTRRSSRQSVGLESSDCLFSPLRSTSDFSHPESSASVTPQLGHAVSDLRTAGNEEDNASPATRLAKLNMSGTPKDRRRSTRSARRVSGFTPPQKVNLPMSTLDSVLEATDLMSFSPGPSETDRNEKTRSRTPRRRSLRPRVSLL